MQHCNIGREIFAQTNSATISQPPFQTFGFSAHPPRLLCSNLLPPFEYNYY
jgi:hypothetical protein